MSREFVAPDSLGSDLFNEADDVLGFSLSSLIWDGPEKDLELTENAQPAILVASLAAYFEFKKHIDVHPVAAAGHSLGEYAALVAAGALIFSDALLAVRERGRQMQHAVPVGEGAMAAVIGLDVDTITTTLQALTDEGHAVGVAGFNSPDQTTISGSTGAIELAGSALKAAGARRVIPLRVSAPFHSALMQPVEEPLRKVLDKLTMGSMAFPVVSNVDAQLRENDSELIHLLIAQLTQPVRWVESVLAMRDAGAQTFIEFGPGRSLSGMIKKCDRSLNTVAIGSPDDLAAALEKLA
ncbi:ACP S-malonyltransferase [Myxococcota bacterium]|nr:ACP S-malonyltransferase [Myxococcota bacterium]